MSFDRAAFDEIQALTHQQQAIWFMNGFWKDEMEHEAEKIWDLTHVAMEIQVGRPKFYGARSKNLGDDDYKQGNDLDQFQAHRFLEKMGQVKTAKELRTELKTIDVDKNNRMSLTEYLLFTYKKTPTEIINAPQGDPKQLARAEKNVNDARVVLEAAVEAVAASISAIKEAKQAAKEANQAKVAQEAALSDAIKFTQEAKEALENLNAEQIKYDDAVARAESRANDSSLGAVARNKAKNELHQLKAKDPLPLTRAKITQKAAVKRSKKAQKNIQKTIEKFEAAEAASEAAAAKAEAAKKVAEEKQATAEAKFQEVSKILDNIKKQGAGAGKIFWLERELKEIKKYMR